MIMGRKWYEYNNEITVDGIYREETIHLCDVADTIYNQIGHDNVEDFIKSLESRCEDWELAENLSFHFMGQLVDCLSDSDDISDLEWKRDVKIKLKKMIDKI